MGFKLATVFVDVVANKSSFENEIGKLRKDLVAISKSTITVDANIAPALEKIRLLKTALGSSYKLNVYVHQAGQPLPQQTRQQGQQAAPQAPKPQVAPPVVPPVPSGYPHAQGTVPPPRQQPRRAPQPRPREPISGGVVTWVRERERPPTGYEYSPGAGRGIGGRRSGPPSRWAPGGSGIPGIGAPPSPPPLTPGLSLSTAPPSGGAGGAGGGGGGRRGGGRPTYPPGQGPGGAFVGFGPRSGRNRLGRGLGMFFQGVSPAEFAVGALQIGAGIMGARAGLALLTAPAQAIREYAAFEEAAKGTEILLKNMGESRKAIEAAEKAARRFGETTIFTARESAEQLQILVRRGYDAADAIEILGASADLAAATGTNLGNAVLTSSQVLKAFALDAQSASRVADMLTQATNTTALGIEDLSAALKFAGPSAHLLGVNVRDTTAALATMVERGITPNIAGRGLRAVFMQLSRPTVQEAFGKMGVPIVDAQGRFRGLLAILRDFNKATATTTGPEKLAFLVQTLGKQAASAFATMASGVDTLEEVARTLDQSLGKSADQAAERLETLSAKWRLLISALSEFAITSGDKASPAASILLGTITELVRGMARGINTVLDFSFAFEKAADSAKKMGDAVRGAGDESKQQFSVWQRALQILGGVAAAVGLYQLSRLGGAAITGIGERIGQAGQRFSEQFTARAAAQRQALRQVSGAPARQAWDYMNTPIGFLLLQNIGKGAGLFGRLVAGLGRLVPYVFLAVTAFQALRAVVNWLTADIRRERERGRNLEAQRKFYEEAKKIGERKFKTPWEEIPLHQRIAIYEDLVKQYETPEGREKFPGLAAAIRAQIDRMRQMLKPGTSPEGARLALDEFMDQMDPSRVRRRKLEEKFKQAEDALLQAEKSGVDPEKIKRARQLLAERKKKMLEETKEEEAGGPSIVSGLGLWRKIQMELLTKDRAEDQRDQMIDLLQEIANLLSPLAERDVQHLTPGEVAAHGKAMEGWREEQGKAGVRPPDTGILFGTDLGYQSGGLVQGPRSPVDSIPALLTGGEVILNPTQQARLALMLGTHPTTLFRMAGVPGFAGGGAVPYSGRFSPSRTRPLGPMSHWYDSRVQQGGSPSIDSARQMQPPEYVLSGWAGSPNRSYEQFLRNASPSEIAAFRAAHSRYLAQAGGRGYLNEEQFFYQYRMGNVGKPPAMPPPPKPPQGGWATEPNQGQPWMPQPSMEYPSWRDVFDAEAAWQVANEPDPVVRGIRQARLDAARRRAEIEMERSEREIENYVENYRRSRQTQRSFPGLHPGAARPDAGLSDKYWQEAQRLLEDIAHPRTTPSGRARRRILEGKSGFTVSAPRYGATDETSPLGRGGGFGRRPVAPPPPAPPPAPEPPRKPVRVGRPKYGSFDELLEKGTAEDRASFAAAYAAYQKWWVENGVGTDMMSAEEFFRRVWIKGHIEWGKVPSIPLSPSKAVRERYRAGLERRRAWRRAGLPQYMLTRPISVQERYRAAFERRRYWGQVGLALPQLPATPADLPPAAREQFEGEMAGYIDSLVTNYNEARKRGVILPGPDYTHPGAQAGARAAAWQRRRRQMHEARRREWRLRKKREGKWIGQSGAARRRWFWRPIFVREEDHLSPRQQYQQMVESLSSSMTGTTLPVFVTNLDGLVSVGYKQITAIKGIGGFVKVVS